jgi:hypothetical protein
MPDWTIEDRITFETDRIVNFGSDASVILYDEEGQELVTIQQFWYIYRKLNFAANAFDYFLKIAEDDAKYDDPMSKVKTIRYTVDGILSEPYEHHGVEAPEHGGKRTWIVSVNKPKFRNNVFIAA